MNDLKEREDKANPGTRPRLVVASDNAGKLAEYARMFPEHEVVGMREAGFTGTIEENGTTFAANARLKAEAVYEKLGGLVVADDSGLCVDLLDGAPGLYSARFAGLETAYRDKFKALWQALSPYDPARWTAAFVAVICLIRSGGETRFFEGRLEGRILPQARGEGGFGYDPIFFIPEAGRTAAELRPEEKDACSHRGRAAAAARRVLLAGRAERGETT